LLIVQLITGREKGPNNKPLVFTKLPEHLQRMKALVTPQLPNYVQQAANIPQHNPYQQPMPQPMQPNYMQQPLYQPQQLAALQQMLYNFQGALKRSFILHDLMLLHNVAYLVQW
jgi:hypothetical protein